MKSLAPFVFIGFIYCIAISETNGNDEKEVTKNSAADYLANFGYITPKVARSAKKGSRSATKAMKSGIKEFQKFANLEPTGELDEATKAKMEQSRCGNADVGKKARAASKWKKNDLTFGYIGLTLQMDDEITKKGIRRAFDTWSAVTPLKFTESNRFDTDFRIGFYTYDHQDGDAFDGKGGTLAHASGPQTGKIHFDNSESWLYMTQENNSPAKTDFYSVAVHEFGHALGLDHAPVNESIMAPFYAPPFDKSKKFIDIKLYPYDIKQIQQLYK